MKEKFYNYFMKVAETTAELSSAERLKVGAVLTRGTKLLSIAYNGTPAGWETNVCEDENGVTKPETLHAERNIICNMAKSTESTENTQLFLTHSPCEACAPMLIQAGIKEVFYKTEYRLTRGIDILEQAGIRCVKI